MTTDTPKEGNLRVWWKPQIPMKQSFIVPVETPAEAKKLLEVLANYDLFQLAERIKPDYCNAGGLSIFEDGEWNDWIDEETGLDIHER
jgi:hypothetical protein